MDELPLLNVVCALMKEYGSARSTSVEPIWVPRGRFINPSGEGSLEAAIATETRVMLSDAMLIHTSVLSDKDGSFYEHLASDPPSAFGEFYLYDDHLWHYPVGSVHTLGSLTITRNPESIRYLVDRAIDDMVVDRRVPD